MWLLADAYFSFLILSFESEIHLAIYDLCDPMDSLPGCSVHEFFQARILEWVAISYSTIPYLNAVLMKMQFVLLFLLLLVLG